MRNGDVSETDQQVLNKAFQGRSKSLGFFEQRFSEADRHLDYIAPMQFHPWKLTPWQAAKLVQAQGEEREGNKDENSDALAPAHFREQSSIKTKN